MNPLDDLLNAMRWQDGASEAVDKIHSLLMINNGDVSTLKDRELLIQRWKTMFQYLERKENIQLTHFSNKEDHPDWFKGNQNKAYYILRPNFNTKCRRCADKKPNIFFRYFY